MAFLNLYDALFAIRRALTGIISAKTERSFSFKVVPVSTISTMTSESPSMGAISIEPFSGMISISLPVFA